MSISGLSSNITKSSNSIDLYQGESKDIYLEVIEEVPDVNGVPTEQPVDLTSSSVYFSVRAKTSSPDLLIGKDSTNILAVEILAPSRDGKAIIHLFPDDTRYMPAGDYVFDIWVTLSNGKRVPVVEVSEFIVKEAVTKVR